MKGAKREAFASDAEADKKGIDEISDINNNIFLCLKKSNQMFM